jgi:FkbM family methyltransferase
VIWVEAIPAVFEQLKANIAEFPRQRAVNAVLTDKSGDWVEFNVASNDGLSSSLLDLKVHALDHPNITYVDKIRLETTTFAAMVRDIDLSKFGALVLDVQGAELIVLKGAGDLIRQFDYIKAEASDAELYAGACFADDLIEYLADYGFRVQRKAVIAKRTYDIIFRKLRS